MSSSSGLDKDEERNVKNIIDALKSEGLFDQFRRECLADVDTKPAYQNLRQRVEGYVSRFLSRQQWSPSLNKNQLRDSLRKQITASGMLANGVERVIEQVINPKILQLIKPKIDEVVCTHLGIDPKERQANIEKKQQQQKENFQSLLNSNASTSEGNLTNTPSSFAGDQTAPTFSSPYSQALWTQQMPPQVAFGGMMPNYPMVPPFGAFPGFGIPPGMPPQMFPFWNNFMFPGAIPGMAGIPFPPPMSSSVATTTTTSSAGQISVSPIPPIPSTPKSTPITMAVETPTPPKSSMPPLPPTPPPPGTEDTPTVINKEEKEGVTKSLFNEESKLEIPEVLDDIPLPPGMGAFKKGSNFGNEDSQEGFGMEDDDAKRQYKFEWNEVVDIDNKSDLSISSVHTSDLSSFEDLESDSENLSDSGEEVLLEEDIEVPQGSPLSAAGDQETEDIDEETEELTTQQEDNTDIVEEPKIPSPTPKLEDEEKPISEPEQTMEESVDVTQSPGEVIPEPPEPEESIPLPPSEEEVAPPLPPAESIPPLPPIPIGKEPSPNKPRKLVSLQFNYSDSEDEESREERKARIAKEKEDRYVKRAQRRAELEAKRKEREEEKARLREERKKNQDLKVDESFEKGQTDSSEKTEKNESMEVSSPEKVPSSPEKKKRKTKAQLKLELTKQKVMEKKEALRRQRTRNRRYTSDEFTSIFTEKKQPYSSQSYSEVIIEEQTFEETVVTDHIEYIQVGEDSPDQPEYQQQFQQQDGTMEGEVILEDGRQLKVEVFMEDMPPSPPTPTQDEPEVINLTEDSEKKRAASPLSDVSDDSLLEVPKGSTKRKRTGSESKSESQPKKSQRYDTSDLYKPRPNIGGSRRRSSPGAAIDREEIKPKKKSKDSRKKSNVSSSKSSRSRSRSRSVESDCAPSPISSSSLASVHSRQSSYSRSSSRSSSSSSGSGESKSRSSSSNSSVDEFGRRKRRKGRMPIDMIDFGEAERMIEKNLYRVSFGEAEKRASSSIHTPSGQKFQHNTRGRGMTRGNWQRQNSWQFPEQGMSQSSWSPPGSPTKRYYYPEPGRSISPSSPYREMREHSPGMWEEESPPYYPPVRPHRPASIIEDSPPHRPSYAMGRRPQSPPPEYLRRSLSPSDHISRGQISPDPWGRDVSMSPPGVRGHRSQSPPYMLGRSPSPGRPYIRGRSPSPPYPPRGAHSPSPPFYRGSSPHRSITRGRTPSPPPYISMRSPSPHRPITRGQRSPSPPMHRRPLSPPSRPVTRGQTAASPYDTRKKVAVGAKVPMTNKLRNIKFGSPYQGGSGRRGSGNPMPDRAHSRRGRH